MPELGILDTSVIIDLPAIAADLLPDQSAITTITIAELAAGPHATTDGAERALRQERLQWAEASFEPLPFDVAAARSYGRLYALVRKSGRLPRRRVADLMIAAIAASQQLPLYTRNADDFAGLTSALTVIAL